MTVAVVAAGAAAVCYGVATVLQAVGARRTPHAGLHVRLFVRLLSQLPYVAGLALDLAGFVLSVVALHSLPLFLVQSVIAASVGVTAVVAVVVLGARLRPVEIAALVASGVGLVLLAVSAKPGHANPLARSAQWALLAALPVCAALGSAAARRHSARAGVALAAVAGAGFAAVGIAARGLAVPQPWWQAVTTPAVWAIVGFGGVAVITFAAALQRGSVTVAAAVMSAIETVVPAAVGLAVLHDSTRAGVGAPVAAIGFVLTLTGVLGLTRYADVAGA
jgi:drug/metabolite transporter (DMT)-like permease